MPKFRAPKRRHIDLGSAYVDVPTTAREIESTEGAGVAATVVSPSTDIIFEILSWLPVKTLCRFRCASKQWHSLISDPAFVTTHESRAEPLVVGRFSGFRGASMRLMDMEGNVVRTREGFHAPPRMLCTSLDGLACFASAYRSADPQVIDMATGEMVLDPSNQRPHLDRHYHANFYDFGFGRAAVSRVYKAVRLIIGADGSFYECQVLALGDGAGWRQAQSPTPPFLCCSYQTSVVIHGVLHFLVSHEKIILCFDLESEKWNKPIKCPGEAMDDNLSFDKSRQIIIAELNGTLCLAQTDLYIDMYSCTDIWLLNDSDNKEIWCKVYTIRMGRTVDLLKPLRMMRDGKKLLFCYIHSEKPLPVLQVYDPLDNKYMEVMLTTTGLTHIMGLCNLPLDCFI